MTLLNPTEEPKAGCLWEEAKANGRKDFFFFLFLSPPAETVVCLTGFVDRETHALAVRHRTRSKRMRRKCKRCTWSKRQVEENHRVIRCCWFKQTHDPQSSSENLPQAQSHPWCHEWSREMGIIKRTQLSLLFREVYLQRLSVPFRAKLCRASRRLSFLAIPLYCSAMKSRVMSAVASGKGGRGGGWKAALVFLPLLQTAVINLDDSLRSCQARALHRGPLQGKYAI